MILNYICHAEFWSEYDRIRTIFQLIVSYLLWTLGEKLTFKSDAHNIRSAKDKATQPEINTRLRNLSLYCAWFLYPAIIENSQKKGYTNFMLIYVTGSR